MSYTKDELIEQKREKLRAYQREYNKKNPDIVNKHRIIYNEKNKDKILRKETCFCGCIVQHKNMKRHLETQKHFDNICKIYQK